MIKKITVAILCMMLLMCCHVFANEEVSELSNNNDKVFNRKTTNTEITEQTENQSADVAGTPVEEMPRNFPKGMTDGSMPSSEGGMMPEGMPQFEGGMMPEGMPSFGGSQRQQGGFPGGFGFPGDQGQISMQEQEPVTFASVIKEYMTPIISMIILGFGFIFVIFYKRTKF